MAVYEELMWDEARGCSLSEHRCVPVLTGDYGPCPDDDCANWNHTWFVVYRIDPDDGDQPVAEFETEDEAQAYMELMFPETQGA